MKNWITLIIVAVVFAGGGYWYGTNSAQKTTTAGAGGFAGAGFTRGAGRTGAAGGGATFGTIVATSPTSITIQMPNSTSTTATTGSKIVLYDTSTMIAKTVAGSSNDLTVGTAVTVAGTANSDGSITATSIQIRPAGARVGGIPTQQ